MKGKQNNYRRTIAYIETVGKEAKKKKERKKTITPLLEDDTLVPYVHTVSSPVHCMEYSLSNNEKEYGAHSICPKLSLEIFNQRLSKF